MINPLAALPFLVKVKNQFYHPVNRIIMGVVGFFFVVLPAFSAITSKNQMQFYSGIHWTIIGLIIFLIIGTVLPNKRRHLRGSKLGTLQTVFKELTQRLGASDIQNAFIPLGDDRVKLPISYSHRGVLILGAPRTGKSVTMQAIIDAMNANRCGGIVFDQADLYINCATTDSLLLDVLDARSVRPNIFKDISARSQDLKLAAKIHFPHEEAKDPFFPIAAGALFECLFKYIHNNEKNPDNTTLYRYLIQYPDIKSMVLKLASDPTIKPDIAGYFSPILEGGEVDRMQMSIYASFTNKMRIYRESCFAQPGDFSLWQHIQDVAFGRSNKVLYIRYRQEDSALVLPYYQTILAITMDRSISIQKIYQPGQEKPTFWICDEFPAWCKSNKDFGKKAVTVLAEAQKRGMAFFIAAQSIGQLEDAIDKTGVASLFDVCGNHMVLRLNSLESAKHYSQMIGEHEYKETKLGTSANANVSESRSGSGLNETFGMSGGLSTSEETRQVLTMLPSEIQALPDLTAMIKIGSTQWFKHSFAPTDKGSTVKFFKPKTDEFKPAELMLPDIKKMLAMEGLEKERELVEAKEQWSVSDTPVKHQEGHNDEQEADNPHFVQRNQQKKLERDTE